MNYKKYIIGVVAGVALLIGILIFAFSVNVRLQDVELPAIKIHIEHQ